MEDKTILEQLPDSEPCHQGADAQQDNGCDSKQGSSNNIGKFKDEKSLLQAYNNLQSEFTKKCQALSQLAKQLEENKINNLPSKQQIIAQKLDQLTQDYSNFASYKDDILALVDSECQDIEKAVYDAMSKFAINNFKTAQNYASEEGFLEKYIYSNENIKQKIIQKYFENTTLNQAPNIIARHVGSKSIVSPKQSPKSIRDAGNIARALFGD